MLNNILDNMEINDDALDTVIYKPYPNGSKKYFIALNILYSRVSLPEISYRS